MVGWSVNAKRVFIPLSILMTQDITRPLTANMALYPLVMVTITYAKHETAQQLWALIMRK